MKTLYISDLDGTLLTSRQTISNTSIGVLNDLLAQDLLFSISTARSPASSFIWKDINLSLPVSTMNGVLLTNQNRFIHYVEIEQSTKKQLLQVFKRYRVPVIFYTIQSNHLRCFCYGSLNQAQQLFVAQRSAQPFSDFKTFEPLNDVKELTNQTFVFGTITDRHEILLPLYEELCLISGLKVHFYVDVYQPENYYLEFNMASCSKATRALELKKQLCADKLVVFGDNHNDLAMFEIADECYAPQNASDEVKRLATGVIDSCDEDGVVRWLMNHAELERKNKWKK